MRPELASLGARLARELGEALYPPLCWLCRRSRAIDGLGCAEHALAGAEFDPAEPRCAGCLERLPRGVSTGPCASCRREGRGYRRLHAVGPYRPGRALAEWILAFKHGRRVDLARPLGRLLARALPERAEGSVLVPVPLHPLKRIERGHDQARLLADAVHLAAGLAVATGLARIRWTAPQGDPAAPSRGANVAGAFALVRGARAKLAGRRVLLVDDVVTSGATVGACAELLRAGGVLEVSVLALARAERRDDGDDADADRLRAAEALEPT